jgi:hypothetical protein
MVTQDDYDSKGRTALLTELHAAQERQVQLHQALISLLAEELEVSRFVVAANSEGASETLSAMVSLAVPEFRKRATTIMEGLKETHEAIQHLLEALRVLRTSTP